ncbi:hypothetical protein EBR57_06090, partial [bacterium]|nr:hypothetical protein [bacterium]
MKAYQIREFLWLHFDKTKFRIFESKVAFICGRLRKLKRHSSKLPYIAELNGMYNQILENYFINLLLLSGKNVDPLFISSAELRKQIEAVLKNPQFIRNLITELIFGVQEKDKISNYECRLSEYTRKYEKFCTDYLADYEFLNAMKHGYRISFKVGGTIGFNGHPIMSSDTNLIYFTKKKDGIYEHSIWFNHKGMIVNLLYALSM